MPWFGMDIGGTLTKLVYFEPNEDEPEGDQEAKIIQKIRHYLTKNAAYGETGHRDIHLQVSRIDFHLETTQYTSTSLSRFSNQPTLIGYRLSSFRAPGLDRHYHTTYDESKRPAKIIYNL